jgi:hypothetical protein
LNLIEDYGDENPNQVGSLQTSLRAPYAESEKVIKVKMSLQRPAMLKLKCKMTVFGGSVSLACLEILEAVPFKAVAAAIPPKS